MEKEFYFNTNTLNKTDLISNVSNIDNISIET